MTSSKQLGSGEPKRYVIVGTGEGASVHVVTGDIRQAVHDCFCCCELGWEKCETEFIKDDIAKLDDADEWSTDDDGRQFSLGYEGEQYSLTVYKDWSYKPAAEQSEVSAALVEAQGGGSQSLTRFEKSAILAVLNERLAGSVDDLRDALGMSKPKANRLWKLLESAANKLNR